jgi:hypothetical protein
LFHGRQPATPPGAGRGRFLDRGEVTLVGIAESAERHGDLFHVDFAQRELLAGITQQGGANAKLSRRVAPLADQSKRVNLAFHPDLFLGEYAALNLINEFAFNRNRPSPVDFDHGRRTPMSSKHKDLHFVADLEPLIGRGCFARDNSQTRQDEQDPPNMARAGPFHDLSLAVQGWTRSSHHFLYLALVSSACLKPPGRRRPPQNIPAGDLPARCAF